MTEKGYISDIYRQVEELMKKCDSLTKELKETKSNLNNQIYKLEQENKKLKIENESLKNEVDRLKKQINNDSNNSSNPPSTDIKPNLKTIPNNREKSGKKIGAQVGHKGNSLLKSKIKEKIDSKEYEHVVKDKGNKKNPYKSKYIIDISVKVIATEYRFHMDENGKYNIPAEFQSDVQYGSEIKTLCSILNTEEIVAINRLTDFVSSISHGKLNISNGTIVNFINELSRKSKPILQNIEQQILNSQVLNTDATTARCENKNVCVRNYSADKFTLLKATTGKSKKCIEETGILNNYHGDLVHDHETVIYNYGNRHGECNVHVSRYLIGCFELTQNCWCKDMRNFLLSLNEYKKKLVYMNIKGISKNKLEEYSLRYDEILENGYKQNKKVKSQYNKSEEKKLLKRLKKYKENHLLFIYDFSIPFDNNLSERELRHVKNKQKISGYFKSMKGLQNYLDIKSIILTCKNKSLDFYKMITNIFQNTPVTIS